MFGVMPRHAMAIAACTSIMLLASACLGEDAAVVDSIQSLRSQVVRIHLESGRWRDARLIGATSEFVVLENDSKNGADTLLLSEVRAIYRDRGRRPTLAGTLLGGVVGCFLGPLVMGAIYRGGGSGELSGMGAIGVVGGGMVFGATAGVVVGSMAFHSWERVYGNE